MNTLVLGIDPQKPDPDVIAKAAAVLRRGGLVAFPTETVYGLGANALDRAAVAGIFLAKGRPANNPIIVHVAAVTDVSQVAAEWPPVAAVLAQRFWPGPLTLVLPKRDVVPDTVTAGGPTVAVRLPAHPVALALIRAAGMPVAAPSANRSSELSPTRAEHVLRGLDGWIDLLLDSGPTPGGIESTVLDVTGSPPRLLRPGLVSYAELEGVIGAVALAEAPTGTLPSPGLLPRHYAPRTPLEVTADWFARTEQLAQAGCRFGVLAFTDAGVERVAGKMLTLPADPAGYAAGLYAALHVLDDANLERIVVAQPPDTSPWLAVRDRLRRAAANP
jgi:L-threonylcarbamoyladenylate synthase